LTVFCGYKHGDEHGDDYGDAEQCSVCSVLLAGVDIGEYCHPLITGGSGLRHFWISRRITSMAVFT
jgi:hypothetical protein